MSDPLEIPMIEELQSELRDRIAAEIDRRKEFRARELAGDLVQLINMENPELLPALRDWLLENEIMRQIDNLIRQRRTQAIHRVRRENATKKKFELLVRVGEITASEEDVEARREAVIDAARDVWNQSVTISKNRRIRLKACTEEDLEYLAQRFTTRAQSMGRSAIFYAALQQLVHDNQVNTVGELPEVALEKAADKLGDEELVTETDE